MNVIFDCFNISLYILAKDIAMSFLIQLFWPYNFSFVALLLCGGLMKCYTSNFSFPPINLSLYWLPEERGCSSKPRWSLVKTHVGGWAYYIR